MRTALATVGQLAVAAAVAVSVVALIAIAQVEWPAYPSSNQLHALTTVGQVGCLVALLGVGVLWRRGHAWVARIGAAACWRPSRWSPSACRWARPGCTCSASRWTNSSAPST
jgi:hypothetical protein